MTFSRNHSKLLTLIFSLFLNFNLKTEEIIKSELIFKNPGSDNKVNGLTKVIRDEYTNLQKLRRKKIALKFNYMLGYYTVNKQTAPFLYDTVEDVCKRLNLQIPGIYVYKGNPCTRFMSYITGADFNCNAWTTLSNFDKSGNYIAIGEDLIDNLTYDELRAVIAHELSHIKKNHVIKKLVLGTFFNTMTFTTVALLTPLIPGVGFLNLGFGFFNLNIGMNTILGCAATMPSLALSRKYEKQADLLAFDVTQDHTSLINSLEKIHDIYKKKHPFWHSLSSVNEHIFPFESHPSIEKRTEYLTKYADKTRQNNKIILTKNLESSLTR